jgi:uncharacterized membrane protein
MVRNTATGGILHCMKQGNPHYARLVLVIGGMVLALVAVSLHQLRTHGTEQQAAVLRAYAP